MVFILIFLIYKHKNPVCKIRQWRPWTPDYTRCKSDLSWKPLTTLHKMTEEIHVHVTVVLLFESVKDRLLLQMPGAPAYDSN